MYGKLEQVLLNFSKLDYILKYNNTVPLMKMPETTDVQDQEINPDQIRRNFLKFFDDLSSELGKWVSDIKAIEIITASGDISFKIESQDSDITDIANGGNVEGKVKILARTRVELDGDLLVILPTKEDQPNSVIVDNEILNIHKENVGMAMQNLQFVFKNVSDWIGALIESSGKGTFSIPKFW
jgi:hypothetical protein